MYPFVPLTCEYRGDVCDLTHFGYICAVDENSNVILHVGDPDAVVYYRSASKPIQALPTLTRGLDIRYGITPEESVIFSASHVAEPFHVNALESIMRKTGIKEEWMCMNPAEPFAPYANELRIRGGTPPRKIYHNCSGKHLALMLLQRDLGGRVEDYWKPDSPAQQEVARVISTFAETDALRTGIDGCGVPVFAAGMKNLAISFKNMVCPERIADSVLSGTTADYIPRIHQYPDMIRGKGYLCSLLNYDPDLVAKGGANGSYCLAVRSERLGISIKLVDGTYDALPLIIMEILKFLGCLSPETKDRLDTLHPDIIYNDNNTVVGRREICFRPERAKM